MNRVTAILVSCLIIVSCITSILAYEKYEQLRDIGIVTQLEERVFKLESQNEQLQEHYRASLAGATLAYVGSVQVNKRISSLIEALSEVLPAGAYIQPPDDKKELDPRFLIPEGELRESLNELVPEPDEEMEPTPAEPPPSDEEGHIDDNYNE